MRIAHNELIYEYRDFKRLSVAAICRRYGLSDTWLDQERNQEAERELLNVQQGS